jgi:hypothetical protein
MLVFHYLVAPSRYLRLLVCPDRPPIAYFPLTRERYEVDKLDHYGVLIAPPPGPLGLRPVVLGTNVIECWLPEEEWRCWKGAGHVQSGRSMMLERIEEEILKLEADPEFPSLFDDCEPPHPFNKQQPPTPEP